MLCHVLKANSEHAGLWISSQSGLYTETLSQKKWGRREDHEKEKEEKEETEERDGEGNRNREKEWGIVGDRRKEGREDGKGCKKNPGQVI